MEKDGGTAPPTGAGTRFTSAMRHCRPVSYTHLDVYKRQLLTNAINYTGEDKKIYVEQSAAGEWVTVRVRDTGEGVSPENLPYIWDRYYKVDKTHKRAVTGTGLGLSIVKSVLELHGGRYGVESTPGGSTFWFQLKTVPPQEEK